MSTITEQVLEGINARPAEERKRSGELGQEDFLELMLAQVRNQDPFSPMENGEFIAQMAQFATVDGIQEMQKSVAALNTTMASSQVLTASTLVGRGVLAPGGAFTLGEQGGVSGVLSTDPGASRLTLSIHDAAGALVARRALAASPDGITRFAFDGTGASGSRLPPGRYRIEAEALAGGSSRRAEVALEQRVDSVTIGAGLDDLRLNLDGGASLPFTDVREFR